MQPHGEGLPPGGGARRPPAPPARALPRRGGGGGGPPHATSQRTPSSEPGLLMARKPSGRPERKYDPASGTVATARRSFARSGGSPSPRAIPATRSALSAGLARFSSPPPPS